MNEWVVSSLVTAGFIILIAVVLYLKEKHPDIFLWIILVIIAIAIFIGLTNVVHSLIYESLPSLQTWTWS